MFNTDLGLEFEKIKSGDENYYKQILQRIQRDREVLKDLPTRIGMSTVDHQLLLIVAVGQLETQQLLTQISIQLNELLKQT